MRISESFWEHFRFINGLKTVLEIVVEFCVCKVCRTYKIWFDLRGLGKAGEFGGSG